MDYVILIFYDCSVCEIIIFFNEGICLILDNRDKYFSFLLWNRGYKENKIK